MKTKIKKVFQMAGCLLLIVIAIFITLGSFKCFSQIPACTGNRFFMFFENYAPQLITMSIIFSGVILILFRKMISNFANNLIFTENLDVDFNNLKLETNDKIGNMKKSLQELTNEYKKIEERQENTNDILQQIQKEHSNVKKYVVETNGHAEKHLREILMYTEFGDNKELTTAREQKSQKKLDVLEQLYRKNETLV